MARKPREEPDAGSWMNTYSDLVTLLLCFFVLLYSMSAVDAEKWQRFASAFQDGEDTNQIVVGESPEDGEGLAPPQGSNDYTEGEATINPEEPPSDFNELYEYLMWYTEQNNMQDSVELFKGEDTVYIRFNNNIFFYPDRAELKQDSVPILDFLGDCLGGVEDQIFLININGHTASVEYENYPVSAWSLSGSRATNIAIFLESNKGISPKKLRPIGYGDNYPVVPNDTEEGRMQNRRVDMVIISTDADYAQSGSIYEDFAGLFDPEIFPKEGGVGDLLVPEEE